MIHSGMFAFHISCLEPHFYFTLPDLLRLSPAEPNLVNWPALSPVGYSSLFATFALVAKILVQLYNHNDDM